ncbi:ribonuclease H-like domain-containing protein [Tanacetum coccineum]
MVTRFRVGSSRPTKRLNLYVSTVYPLPKSYVDAFNDPNWQNAINEEYNALIKNNTWTLILADRTLSRYKARRVANGSTHLSGIDVDATFSLVVKPCTIQTVLSFAISRHWLLHIHVRLLQRSLYGLKRAPQAWFQRFAAYITHVGFYHSRSDSSLFIYKHGTTTTYLLLYVDDIVSIASSKHLLQLIIDSLHHEFSMTDMGALNYFLSNFVMRDSSRMFISQRKYATHILEQANIASCNPIRTPVDTESKLGGDGALVSDPTLYRSPTGSL